MLKKIREDHALFIDIETVPAYKNFSDTPEEFQKFWEKKASRIAPDTESPENVWNRAGIYAEFGKIVCISAGFIYEENKEKKLRIKSFFGDNEKELLSEFSELLKKSFNTQDKLLCAHNGKEFDFPYISRRLLINGLPIPDILDLSGKKPWEIKHLDTLDLWKFGDYKHYTSLDLLAYIFGVPSSKTDMDGSMVADVYWNEHDLNRIAEYCEADIVTLVRIFLKITGRETIIDDNIVRLTDRRNEAPHRKNLENL